MRRYAGFLLAFLMAGCASGADDVRFTVAGKILDRPGGSGAAGVAVECPAAGVSTLTLADGSFTLVASVPREGLPIPGATSDKPAKTAQVGIRVRQAGRADVLRTVVPVDGATVTLITAVGRALQTKQMKVPASKLETTDVVGNATVTIVAGSLLDPAGVPVTGAVDLVAAAWDPSLPYKPATADVKDDAVTTPYSPAVLARDGSAPWVRVLAAAQVGFQAGGLPLSVAPDPVVALDLASFNADETFGRATVDDVHVYRQDPDTGLLVEREAGTVFATNQLRARVDEPGTWIWARPVPDATCVTVKTVAGQNPTVGAHVQLLAGGLNPALLDEQVGSPAGSACLRGPSGRSVRVAASLVPPGAAPRTASAENVLLTGGGSCETTCPVEVTVTFPCASAADCATGSVCTEGTCTVATP